MKNAIIGGVVLIILLAGMWGYSRFSGSSVPAPAVPLLVADDEWIKGASSSPATLIEYSDFQCPACGAYYPIVKQVVSELGENIRVVYRHFPLRQIHPNAEILARAAEAAGRQGKFWEMHDMLFDNQKTWSGLLNAEDAFIGYAQKLDLDINKFKKDIDLKEVKDAIESDFQGGLSLEVNSTPTFFLNGVKLQNPRTYEEFKALIEKAISESKK